VPIKINQERSKKKNDVAVFFQYQAESLETAALPE
jgi:hypothetical protein